MREFPVRILPEHKLVPVKNRYGQYSHPWSVPPYSIWSVVKWVLSRKLPPIPSKEELERILPISSDFVNILKKDYIPKDYAMWLSHSTVMVHMANKNILFDPVFSDNVPAIIGPKRFWDSLVLTKFDLPRIDYVMISHNHYDHLDAPSIKHLSKWFPNIEWFCGTNVGKTIRSIIKKNNVKIHEFVWFDDYILADKSLQFIFLPTQHNSVRNGIDYGKSLWGSWAVCTKQFRFFFAGDTGYNTQLFELIGSTVGPFDISAIPIGAYTPRSVMKIQHISPHEAVKVHQNIRSKKSFAIHWGTFPLADECFLDPPEDLAKALKVNRIDIEDFIVLKVGQCLEF